MGSAMVAGILDAGWASAGELAVADPDARQRDRLAERHPGLVVLDAPVDAEGALLAVKQEAVDGACRALGVLGVPRVLSVVAGINTARLESVLPPGTVVVRAIPNTPSLVGAGVAAMSGGGTAIGADLDWAEEILAAVGHVVRLPERHLDAVTGLSGSGPAYVFLMAEAMIEAGSPPACPGTSAGSWSSGPCPGRPSFWSRRETIPPCCERR